MPPCPTGPGIPPGPSLLHRAGRKRQRAPLHLPLPRRQPACRRRLRPQPRAARCCSSSRRWPPGKSVRPLHSPELRGSPPMCWPPASSGIWIRRRVELSGPCRRTAVPAPVCRCLRQSGWSSGSNGVGVAVMPAPTTAGLILYPFFGAPFVGADFRPRSLHRWQGRRRALQRFRATIPMHRPGSATESLSPATSVRVAGRSKLPIATPVHAAA